MIRRFAVLMGGDFERALDEFFDEMLIAPWREHSLPEEFARSRIIERRDRYEVWIALAGIDPAAIEVEMKGQRLCVRTRKGRGRAIESSFSFASPIDAGAVSAKYVRGVLVINIPRRGPTRIKITEA
jgi:HSP20 family molecular chaperone IbpA